MKTCKIKVKLVSQGHPAAKGSGDVQTQLLLRTMLASIVLPRLGGGADLKYGSCTATNGHIEA